MRAEGRRFPGSFGSAFMYPMVPGTILFREEHSRRTLVPKVDFVSARGNPKALLTGKALFSWQKDRGRFRLESFHPGESAASIASQTGFEYDAAPSVGETPVPGEEELPNFGQIRMLAILQARPWTLGDLASRHHVAASTMSRSMMRISPP